MSELSCGLRGICALVFCSMSCSRSSRVGREKGQDKGRRKEHPWKVARPALQIGGLRTKTETPQNPSQHTAPRSPRQSIKK